MTADAEAVVSPAIPTWADVEVCHVDDGTDEGAMCGYQGGSGGWDTSCGVYHGEAICPSCGRPTCPKCALLVRLEDQLMDMT